MVNNMFFVICGDHKHTVMINMLSIRFYSGFYNNAYLADTNTIITLQLMKYSSVVFIKGLA